MLEASAGTGKTYAIAGLVARYVAEGWRLPDLLVVTFTRAATAELRERVRSRLVSVADHLEQTLAGGAGEPDDPVGGVLARGTHKQLTERHRRLSAALAEFDAATIATIHGFCQHVLLAVGLAGDVDHDASFVEDPTELVEAVVDDLYVRAFHTGAREVSLRRGELLKLARAAVANPDAALVPADVSDPVGRLRLELARACRDEVDRRKRAGGLLDYDDLLTRLRDTLQDPQRGQEARDRLRAQYRVALIDEFQDTDPIQWDILRSAFGRDGGALVLIGDPKQAIYAFRGADVYAYLEAARAAARRHTLETNWRSDQALLDAYNVFFAGAALGHPEIAHRPVHAAPRHRERRLTGDGVGAPLRLRVVPRSADVRLTAKGKKVVTDSAREHIAADVAAETVRLLQSGALVVDPGAQAARGVHAQPRVGEPGPESGPEHPGAPVASGTGASGFSEAGRPLQPRDLAVLVRTNAEASLVQRRLRDAGVPAVINGVGSVFATQTASDWLRLLEALERPASPARARTVALTVFCGWTAEQLAAAGDEEIERLHARLHWWAAILRDRGVASLLRTISLRQRLPARLLARLDGERLLTDVEHVGELLHAAASAEELGPTALAGWLREQITRADEDLEPEERARRLESDAEAVQVLTIHRSKGLEFPVVFCPYLWSSARPRIDVPVFHLRDGEGHRLVDVGGPTHEDFEEHCDLAEAEQRGEDLRLLYVALTRARHQAVLWWAPAGWAEESPVARVLFCRRPDGEVNTRGTPILPDDEQTLQRLAPLVERSGGAIAVETTPDRPRPDRWTPPTHAGVTLDAARFERGIDERWRRTSYSALTAGVEHEPAVGSEPDEVVTDDEPDVTSSPTDGPGDPATAPAIPDEEARLRAVSSPLADLPGGTSFGTFVHAVFEDSDFAAADLDAELGTWVAEYGEGWLRDPEAQTTVVAGLRGVLDTPLGPLAGERSLGDVDRIDRLDELAFELPLAGGPRPSGDLAVTDLAAVLQAQLPPDDPLAGYAQLLGERSFQRRVRGYLTGSIDLVLRLRDGRVGKGDQRFVVVDYKTNRLGALGESLTCWQYRPQALAAGMAAGHYPLQALLYQVALHRYLRWRLAGYDPAVHLGGALYLFVRGMAGAATPRVDGQPCGVFAWSPPWQLIVAVSDLLDRGEAAA